MGVSFGMPSHAQWKVLAYIMHIISTIIKEQGMSVMEAKGHVFGNIVKQELDHAYTSNLRVNTRSLL